jgi:hypothetical protein
MKKILIVASLLASSTFAVEQRLDEGQREAWRLCACMDDAIKKHINHYRLKPVVWKTLKKRLNA